MRIDIAPTPPEGVQYSIGLGQVGRHVSIEELKGVLLACGMSSGVLQGGRYGLGGCVELCTAWMGPKSRQVFGGQVAEELILPFAMLVHLGIHRMGLIEDEGRPKYS